MMFSICMAVYNAQETVSRAIQSVLCQSFEDYELIIADDGSGDRTCEILEKFVAFDSRIHVLSKERQGLFRTRLRSLKEARGEYVITLDSDDALASDALSVLSGAVKESHADIVQYCARKVYPNGKSRKIRPLMENGAMLSGKSLEKLFDSLVVSDTYTTLWNKAIKRTCMETARLEACPDVSIGEDNIIMMFVMKQAASYFYITDELYLYTASGGCSRQFRGDSFQNHQNRMQAKKMALTYAEKEYEDYKEALERFSVKTVSKLCAYMPNQVGKAKEEYFKCLDEIFACKEFWETYDRQRKNIGLLYKVPLYLLHKKKYHILLRYKQVWERIRRKMD